MPSPRLGPHQFIEKPLKGSKSSYKGQSLESIRSKQLHAQGSALLISSLLLRSYGCAQVDISLVKNSSFIIFEVKSKPAAITKRQLKRLYNSLELVCSVLNAQGCLKVIK